MDIIGWRLEKIEAEKSKEPTDSVSVRTNFNIGEITKSVVLGKDKNKDYSNINFSYELEYQDVGKILFKGFIIVEFDKKPSKESSKEIKNISDEEKTLLLNFILFRTHAEALHLEEKMGLPFHLVVPRASLQKNKV